MVTGASAHADYTYMWCIMLTFAEHVSSVRWPSGLRRQTKAIPTRLVIVSSGPKGRGFESPSHHQLLRQGETYRVSLHLLLCGKGEKMRKQGGRARWTVLKVTRGQSSVYVGLSYI
jgi:hypothetical protein